MHLCIREEFYLHFSINDEKSYQQHSFLWFDSKNYTSTLLQNDSISRAYYKHTEDTKRECGSVKRRYTHALQELNSQTKQEIKQNIIRLHISNNMLRRRER